MFESGFTSCKIKTCARAGGFALTGAVLVLLLSPAGCGTIDSQVGYWDPVESDGSSTPVVLFGGTVTDAKWAAMVAGPRTLGNPEALALLPFLLLDFPLSLAADTVLLPLTTGQQIVLALSDSTQGERAESMTQPEETPVASSRMECLSEGPSGCPPGCGDP